MHGMPYQLLCDVSGFKRFLANDLSEFYVSKVFLRDVDVVSCQCTDLSFLLV